MIMITCRVLFVSVLCVVWCCVDVAVATASFEVAAAEIKEKASEGLTVGSEALTLQESVLGNTTEILSSLDEALNKINNITAAIVVDGRLIDDDEARLNRVNALVKTTVTAREATENVKNITEGMILLRYKIETKMREVLEKTQAMKETTKDVKSVAQKAAEVKRAAEETASLWEEAADNMISQLLTEVEEVLNKTETAMSEVEMATTEGTAILTRATAPEQTQGLQTNGTHAEGGLTSAQAAAEAKGGASSSLEEQEEEAEAAKSKGPSPKGVDSKSHPKAIQEETTKDQTKDTSQPQVSTASTATPQGKEKEQEAEAQSEIPSQPQAGEGSFAPQEGAEGRNVTKSPEGAKGEIQKNGTETALAKEQPQAANNTPESQAQVKAQAERTEVALSQKQTPSQENSETARGAGASASQGKTPAAAAKLRISLQATTRILPQVLIQKPQKLKLLSTSSTPVQKGSATDDNTDSLTGVKAALNTSVRNAKMMKEAAQKVKEKAEEATKLYKTLAVKAEALRAAASISPDSTSLMASHFAVLPIVPLLLSFFVFVACM